MNIRDKGKRARCKNCGFPQKTCLCDWVHPLDSPLNIIILQHPKETNHAKNTVKLLNLGLRNLHVLQGETPEDWESLVKAISNKAENYSLCYPNQHSIAIESISSSTKKTQYFPIHHHVIFIDASWRKALKIWYLNPWLHELPSWHFNNPPKNQYHIRHTTQKNSLSTLESVAYVLEHSHNTDCSALYNLFTKMQQQSFVQNRSR